MKINIILFFLIFILFSCSSNELKLKDAKKILIERINKSPKRTVFFYVGAITDRNYLSVYEKISGKYLKIRRNVYIPAAHKKMTLFEPTDAGKNIFKCKKNRCEVELCQYFFKSIDKIFVSGKNATINYTVSLKCDDNLYKIFKPLALKQYLVPKDEKRKAYLFKNEKNWEIIREE